MDLITDNLTVRSALGLEDRPPKMSNEQLEDFVGMVSSLKQGGLHQKSGQYKTAWHAISQVLKTKYDVDYSVEYLRSQWHLRLKVTRRRFYAVTDTLTDNGLPITEEAVDGEMLRDGALCKPCDRIIYCHFRKIWLDQRLSKSENKVSSSPPLAEISQLDPRLPSPQADDLSFLNNILGLDVKEDVNESLRQFILSLPASTMAGLKEEEPEDLPSDETPPEEQPPMKKAKVEVEDKPIQLPTTATSSEDPMSLMASSLRILADCSLRQTAALEGIHSLLQKLIPQ